jgi:hypothetical protein
MHRMDTTIRNIDEAAFRQLKARAALSGKTLGQALSEAIRCYLGRPAETTRLGTLGELVPEDYPEGSERLSEEIDRILYGA